MGARFRDSGETIYRFGAEFLVRCPRCQRRASVIPLPGHEPTLFAPRRLVCAQCSYTKDWREKTVCIGGSLDWYFRLPLWLQTPCCGQMLWAYNKDHLDFLEAYVQADLRERVPNRNGSLASRLPAWIKAAHHRDEVLRGIEILRKKLRKNNACSAGFQPAKAGFVAKPSGAVLTASRRGTDARCRHFRDIGIWARPRSSSPGAGVD